MHEILSYPEKDVALKLFDSGRTINQIADAFNITHSSFYAWWRRNKLPVRPLSETMKIALAHYHSDISSEVIQLYASGNSVKAIATQLDVDRNVIHRLLLRAGIKPRNRSESMYLRMSKATEYERQQLSDAAHKAVKGKLKGEVELHNRALGYQRTCCKQGGGEEIFAKWLKARGLKPTMQLAVGRYNLDVACHPLDIEIHISATNPLKSKHLLERSQYLNSQGWSVLFVWVSHSHFLTERAADFAIDYFASCKDSAPKTLIIRGNG
jgi:transposase-like protein